MNMVIYAAGILVIVLGVLAFTGILVVAVCYAISEYRDKATRGRFRILREFLEWLNSRPGMDDLSGDEMESLLKDYCRFLDAKSKRPTDSAS